MTIGNLLKFNGNMAQSMFALIFLFATLMGSGVLAQQSEVTNIDLLTSRYLTLEKALWQVIRGGSERNYVIQRIHDIHLTFFAENFNEKGVHLTLYDHDQKLLHSSINHINLTTAVVNDMYLHANAEDYKRDESIGFSRYGVNMTQHMAKIFNITENTDFFQYIVTKGKLQSCMVSLSTIQSTGQLLYNYYTDIAAAQLKAYALAQLSFMFLTVYEVENYVMRAQELQYLFKQRNTKTQERVHELMANANRDVWVCDPDNPHASGYSDEVTNFLQGYVDNEVNLNQVNDCKKSCHDYKHTQNYLCFNGSFCAHDELQESSELRCKGAVVDCEFIGADMTICPSMKPSRRYDHIKYDCALTLGSNSDSCSTIATRATSWTRWFVECSNCFCYCDEQGPKSDRYFSLRPVLSDISQNKVITGVALRKQNRIFQWRITQRLLTNNGQVDTKSSGTASWKPASLFNVNERHIVEGVDYHTLTWQNRSLNLDVLTAPPGRVVTGVSFAVDSGSLKIKIRTTSFDFNTGLLHEEADSSVWMSNTINDRAKILVDHPDVPTKSSSKSIPDLEPNKYIEFQPTDKFLDASQTTIPFVDIQLVEPEHPVPLAGIGLYYKGQPQYGGFVAPKVVTYDYTTHVKTK